MADACKLYLILRNIFMSFYLFISNIYKHFYFNSQLKTSCGITFDNLESFKHLDITICLHFLFKTSQRKVLTIGISPLYGPTYPIHNVYCSIPGGVWNQNWG